MLKAEMKNMVIKVSAYTVRSRYGKVKSRKYKIQTTFFFFQLLLNRQQHFNPETRAFLRLMLTKLRVSVETLLSIQ